VASTTAASTTAASTSASTGAGGPDPTGDLEVLYKVTEPNETTQHVKFSVQIKNTGDASVALSDVTLRYYFTSPSTQHTFVCDHAAITGGDANVTGTFGTVTSPDADYYLEIGFKPAAGSLAQGATTGEVQARFHTTDFKNFTQAEHYSFDETMTRYTLAPNVTAYVDGVLAWGVEP
jgi:hypothetical protein